MNEFLNTYALVPFKTMYMNALKMVVAPVVFFSMVMNMGMGTIASVLAMFGTSCSESI